MAGFFKRMFGIAKAESHAVLDKIEDPIRMTEQGIRDLKKDLQASMESLAQVKAASIRLKNDADDQKSAAADFERKAMLLLQKVKSGQLEQGEGERLATEALSKKSEFMDRSGSLTDQYQKQHAMADQLQSKINNLKQTIRKYENDLITLKARAKTANSMKKINQQLASIDSNSTLAMLERMKDRVQEEESLAEAYGQVAGGSKTVEDEIDKALAAPSSNSDELAELKKKMGM